MDAKFTRRVRRVKNKIILNDFQIYKFVYVCVHTFLGNSNFEKKTSILNRNKKSHFR